MIYPCICCFKINYLNTALVVWYIRYNCNCEASYFTRLSQTDLCCICNLLISYWSCPPSGCAYRAALELQKASGKLYSTPTSPVMNHITAKASGGPVPSRKITRLKQADGKAAQRSTSCHIPPPHPSSKLMSRHGPPESALGTRGHLYKWAQGTNTRRL